MNSQNFKWRIITMKKKLVSLLCATTMIVSALVGCGTQDVVKEETKNSSVAESKTESSAAESTEAVESEYPEYLNLDSAYPIIKDEYEGTIKLTAIIRKQAATGEWENLWLSKYLKDKYNVELEVEYVDGAALAERKSLMLNSGELPDLMLDMKFTTGELLKYGQDEGLFLACDEYMNETLTPNILKSWSERVEAACTTPDGHVYSLPYLVDDVDINPGNLKRMSINTKLLKQLNLEIPRTLDDFVDVLYKLKAADPTGVGSENFYPMGGGMDMVGVGWFILNALGYNNNDNYGFKPAVRDGEAVIPVYDMDVYQEYLKLLNQFYNDGIINPNYFTIERTEVDAQAIEGKTALYAENLSVISAPELEAWESCYPLTSDWQTEPETYWPNTITVGGYVISADTEYPELCMRIADMYFNNETDMNSALYFGVEAGTEYNYEGYSGWKFDEATQNHPKELPEGYSDWNYTLEFLAGYMPKVGTYNLRESRAKMVAEFGYDMQIEPIYDLNNPSHIFNATALERVAPYVADTYPEIYYISDEVNSELSALETVIQPYVKEQVALFITGKRPLSETGAFVEELKGMGMDRVLEIYTDIYNEIK